MASIATAYEVTFHPADPNVCAADCMDTYCHDTLAAAQTAIAEDAKDTAGSILHDDYPAWKAYAIASANAAVDALEGADTYAYPITVTSGDNPRPIGTYRIRIIHEGDLMECTTCGSGDGSVTAIHGGGNVHATCPDCAADADRAERDAANTTGVRYTPGHPTCETCDGALIHPWVRGACPDCNGTGRDTGHDYATIAETALDAAILHIQNTAGETTGDYAGVWFASPEGDAIRDILRRYAEDQIAFSARSRDRSHPTPTTPTT